MFSLPPGCWPMFFYVAIYIIAVLTVAYIDFVCVKFNNKQDTNAEVWLHFLLSVLLTEDRGLINVSSRASCVVKWAILIDLWLQIYIPWYTAQ